MEIENKSILFIAYDCHNKAVWNAFKLHIELIHSLGYNLSFIVDEKYKEIVELDYPTAQIHTYSNFFYLIFQLNKLPEKKIYSPATFPVVASLLSKILNSKELYYWVQGIIPEESFLRHKSKIRFKILSGIEYISLALSSKQIFVSQEMQNYLEKKYNTQYKNSIIVPCISEFKDDNSKKEKDSFVYIGGMSAWQRIDQMLEIFSYILSIKPNAKLYIATLEKKLARDYIEQYIELKYHENIEVLSINNRKDIPYFLSTKEYGFLIREDNIVNHVASPIKLAEYLSCGVNVIISTSIKSYASYIEDNHAGINLNKQRDIIQKLKHFIPNRISAIEVYEHFFSKNQHSLNYQTLLK